MERRKREAQVMRVLARPLRMLLEEAEPDFEELQEIRIRTGKPFLIVSGGREQPLPSKGQAHLVAKEEIRETLSYISNYSLYAYEQEMKQGFITIEGGHRVGMAGKAMVENEKIKNLQYISSINIRISHEVPGCADKVFPYIVSNKQVCHTLIISPPGCGKTTLLRDMIRQISDGNAWVQGSTVGVVDERSEIGGCYMGVAQNRLGMRSDILDCCPKAEGMMMLIRSMGPRVIAVDEIGTKEDVHAIEYAMHCGCKMLATVHGSSIEEIGKKPLLKTMVSEHRFDRYIVLASRQRPGEVEGIYDERGIRCM